MKKDTRLAPSSRSTSPRSASSTYDNLLMSDRGERCQAEVRIGGISVDHLVGRRFRGRTGMNDSCHQCQGGLRSGRVLEV